MLAPHQSELRKGRCSIPGQIYHIVTTTYARQPLFINWDLASIACQAFTSAQTLQDSSLLCWVLMPDHAHWLLQLGSQYSLSQTVARLKSRSSHAIQFAYRQPHGIWGKGFYDRAIRKEEDLTSVARYIVANPLRAGICTSLYSYPYWDAIFLHKDVAI